MFSLASFKYRSFCAQHVEQLETRPAVVNGGRLFVSKVWLHEALIPVGRRGLSTAPLGTGSGTSTMLARHKALSEAIERWAFLTKIEEEPHAYGFDVDPSSNGMCAYPGIGREAARDGALAEAVERFCVSLWWEGALRHETLAEPVEQNPRLIRIHNPYSEHDVVVAFGPASNGLIAYGTGAARTLKRAIARAKGEQAVGRLNLESMGGPGGEISPADVETSNFLVKRLVYFAQPEGHQQFMERVSGEPSRDPHPPRLVFDGAIPGPWSRFATVWRVAYEPVSTDFLDPSSMFFFL